MTMDEMTAMLETMSDEHDPDILITYLLLAGKRILDHAFPFDDVTEVPEKWHINQVEIAAYMIQKIGMEGETARTENGINQQFAEADIPKALFKNIIPMAGLL